MKWNVCKPLNNEFAFEEMLHENVKTNNITERFLGIRYLLKNIYESTRCQIYHNILANSFYNRMIILLMRVFDFGAFIALQCLLMHDLHATHKIRASGAN